MLNRSFSLALIIVLMLVGVSGGALAQDPTPLPPAPTATPEPLPDCPAFESEDDSVRRSYYMGEGAAYATTGQLFDAIFSYTCVIRVIDGQYVPAYMARASAYARQRDYERAIEDYTTAIGLDGSLAAAYNNRGVLYAAIDEAENAAADFERVISLESDNYAAANNRAILHMLEDEFDEALAVLEGVVSASGIDEVLETYRNAPTDTELEPIEFDSAAARAYGLIGIVYSQMSLSLYQDYVFLGEFRNQYSSDQRIVGAAGALESRFAFEMRLDDGTWMSVQPYSATGN